MTYADMPIERDALEADVPALPVKPGTNGHAILRVLLEHPDLGFTPSELADLTEIGPGSVSKTLSRLEDRDLVEQTEGYWMVADEAHATYVGSLLSLEAIEDRHGEDFYGREEGWADELPDLGESE
jgi:DNA-binding transcriptional ArsR family regulator